MRTQTVTKSETIKFNVSPRFKEIVQEKADSAGMSLSDLGRILFGAYVHNLISSPTAPTSLDVAVQEAEAELSAGETVSIKNKAELKTYLDRLKDKN